MAAVNNFKPFGIGSGANVTAQTDYEALAALIGGFQSGKASSAQINKALRQGTVMSSVLAQFIANTSGADVLDNGDTATILNNLLAGLKSNISSQLTGVVGATINAAMSISAASASATFTADEVIVETALGGAQYRIGSFSKTINLATTGAGGMDTGTVPASGFVAIYAIYNPTTGVSALLAVNSTSGVSPEVYGGSNMPTGYTASALVSTWQISFSQFSIGVQRDRHVTTLSNQVFSATSSIPTTPTSLSLSSYIPPNAKVVDLFQRFVATTADLQQMAITSTTGSVGLFGSIFNSSSVGQQFGSTGCINLAVPQVVYYYQTGAISTTRQLYITGYTF